MASSSAMSARYGNGSMEHRSRARGFFLGFAGADLTGDVGSARSSAAMAQPFIPGVLEGRVVAVWIAGRDVQATLVKGEAMDIRIGAVRHTD